MVNPNRFYTYAYLREDRTPYYIGKGEGNRAYKKGKGEIKPPRNKSRIIFLKQNLIEDEAFKHEIYMIAVFGRKDLGTGILHNRTNGGEGSSGLIHSPKAKAKMSAIKKGKNHPFYGKTHSPETKAKMSSASKGKTHSPEARAKISGKNNHNYGKIYTEEERENLSKKTKGIPKSKEHREKISKGKKGKPVSESHRKNLGHNKGKKWWNDEKGNRKLSIECPGEDWVIGMNLPCSEERKEKIKIKAIGRVRGEPSAETKIKISRSSIKYLYELQSPNGEVFITNNLTDFCKENLQYGLNRRLMCSVAHGKQKRHKGWIVRILKHLTNWNNDT
jgi:hypothetical protein